MTDAMLFRSVPFEIRAADEQGDGLTLEGYAAVFDTPTRINSWEGFFDEQISRGAFKKSISERTPVLQFDHGRHPMVGSIPLGSIEKLSEDSDGLFVRARLHDNWMVQPVRDAIASGSVDGMSFRFQVVKDDWRLNGKLIKDADELQRILWAADPDNVPVRTLREVKVAELGPVVFPAYPTTSVGVRSQELASAFADPEVRAELARLLLLGTPSASDESGDSGADERAAESTTPEPLAQHSDAPSLLAIASAYDTRKVI
jgi:hypothetical protein